jgi:hypothetical protein
MRVPWKLVGLAGLAGVAAGGGVVLARKHRAHRDYRPDELRERLHRRLAEVTADGAQPTTTPDTRGLPTSNPSFPSARDLGR